MSGRKRQASRAEILDAAIAVLERNGAGAFTIDAVAEESGFSKGGVLYNFPSKNQLITGMVGRIADQFDAGIGERLAAHKDSESPTLSAMIDVTSDWLSGRQSLAAALMAAHVNNPELFEPFLDFKQRLREQIREEIGDYIKALTIISALEGLHFTMAHGVAMYSDDERHQVLDTLRAMLRPASEELN